MGHFETLSGEILMAIFEYMDVEDVYTIFFNMNTRLNSLVYDSRLRLTADVSKVEKYNFDQFCLSLLKTNFSNIYTLILSNNYYRYPQIRQFLSYTNFMYFQSLCSLTLIDINHDELMEIIKQIQQLKHLKHLHLNTHEICSDGQLANVTRAVFELSNIRVLGLGLHEKIQWRTIDVIPSCNIEVLSLNFINIDRLFALLPHCPQLRSLCMTLDSRNSLPISTDDNLVPESIIQFPQINHLRFYFRPFNASVLKRLLNSLPSIKRFSIDTLAYKTDCIRAPFWTLLLQERLPLLERIRLVVREWYIVEVNDYSDEDLKNLIGGYECDRYWLERAHKKIFTCQKHSLSTVLQIR